MHWCITAKGQFSQFSGKEVTIFAKEIKLISKPLDPNSNICRGSSVPPEGCCGVYKYLVSDGKENITVISSNELRGETQIITGIFGVGCKSIPKKHCGCKIENHFCTCDRCVGAKNVKERVGLEFTLITEDALEKLKESSDVRCISIGKRYSASEKSQAI